MLVSVVWPSTTISSDMPDSGEKLFSEEHDWNLGLPTQAKAASTTSVAAWYRDRKADFCKYNFNLSVSL